MLSAELEYCLNEAFQQARTDRHEFMTVEHLLLALIDNESAANVLRACGADLNLLRKDLVEFVDSTTPLIPEADTDRETQPTLGFQRVLQRAVFHVVDIDHLRADRSRQPRDRRQKEKRGARPLFPYC